MRPKKRVLFCSEATYLSTGYATYTLEVMRRLHATGKYELAELASYGDTSDPRETRWADVPWAFFPVMPDRNDRAAVERYNASPTSQFGEWKFEETLLAFRPDVVCDIRDWWMVEYQERSALRPYYHWALMPTVDAAPQDEQWLATYMNADAVFTYSDWGLEVLREQTRGRAKLKCSAPPGADPAVFRPVADPRAHRVVMGLDPDCLLVGTVMRNQKRKLYPDLIRAFAGFLGRAEPGLAQKTFLYMHTSWPDVGWDIPRLVAEAGLGHKCVFTYYCRECHAAFPSFFADARTHCRACGKYAATFPNSHLGVSREVLAGVINLFDVYVQYANSEGFGMPLVEAAACGVPVMAVDYSAMSDVVRKLRGTPLRVERLSRESETHCWRALPDDGDFGEQLARLLSLPAPARRRLGHEARLAAAEHYTYDRTARTWEDHLDACGGGSLPWDAPPRTHRPAREVPAGLSNEEFVAWGISEVAGRPDLAGSYLALRMARDLNWEASPPHTGGNYFNEASTLGTQQRYQPFSRDDALGALTRMCEERNHWERRRAARP